MNFRDEDKRTMQLAAEEIRQLRRENEILGAKVEVMELFGLTLRTQPNYGGRGMSEDVVWKIERTLEAFEKDRATQSEVA